MCNEIVTLGLHSTNLDTIWLLYARAENWSCLKSFCGVIFLRGWEGSPTSSHWGLAILLACWVDKLSVSAECRRNQPAGCSEWFVRREHHGCLGHQRRLTGLPSCPLSLLRLPPQPLPRQPERKVMVMPAQSSGWYFLGFFIWWGFFSRGRASSKWTPSFWIYGLPCLQWENCPSLCFENDSHLNCSSNCWTVVQYIMRDLIREGKL